jgi:hypothetical protein
MALSKREAECFWSLQSFLFLDSRAIPPLRHTTMSTRRQYHSKGLSGGDSFEMPAKVPTPAEKQRVRTGCLTCRKRRRKCDERKPQCENCEAKGMSCSYGVHITFLEPSNPGASESEAATTQRHTPGYARLKFLDGRPKASTRPAKRACVEAATVEPLRINGLVNQVVQADHGSPFWNGQNDDDSLFVEQDPTLPIQRRVTGSLTEPVLSSNLSIGDFGQRATSQGEQEAELFRQDR